MLGAGLPKSLMPSNPGNAKGYFESLAFMDFHSELLTSAGTDWLDWRSLNPAWYGSATAAEFRRRAGDLFKTEFGDTKRAVFKDPRACRFLPFWLEVLEEMEVRPHIVMPIRSPADVALSLRQQHGLPLGKGMALWLRHCLDAEAHSRTIERSIFTWKDFCLNWRAACRKIATDVHLSWPSPPDGELHEIDRFLMKELVHHNTDLAEFITGSDIDDWTLRAYQAFLELARSAFSKSALDTLDQLRALLDQTSQVPGDHEIDPEGLQNQRRTGANTDDHSRVRQSEAGVNDARPVARAGEGVRQMTALSVTEFVKAASRYKVTLAAANSFDEILLLWRGTDINYSYLCSDPYSDDYRCEVLELYNQLTNKVYSINNELTSTKRSDEMFQVGYPWSSKNLSVIASEMAKTVQALNALSRSKSTNQRVIEFGAGWGNLSLPVARAGRPVTVVDIDEALLRRINRLAVRDNLPVSSIKGDFNNISRDLSQRFGAVVFQSSFHHCLEFEQLLKSIRNNVLEKDGQIFFLSEPIYKNYQFPWGLRSDGEALWAIMYNDWLELGFDETFFINLLLKNGFFVSTIPEVNGYVGSGLVASRGELTIAFESVMWPEKFELSFHSANGALGYGRFCAKQSRLPGLSGGVYIKYEITFKNFSPTSLTLIVSSGATSHTIVVSASETRVVAIHALSDVIIESEIYFPDALIGNGDKRQLGLAILDIKLS